MDLPPDLRGALDTALGGIAVAELTTAVAGLVARYRAPDVADPGGAASAEAVLAAPVDVMAYAAYRMPATYAAVRAALTQVSQAVPGFSPRSLLDIGGGTGAACWAATDVFASLAEVAVLDRLPAALDLGRRLAVARPVLGSAHWRPWRLGDAGESPLPAAELVTVSYLLGELPSPTRSDLVATAARAGGVRAVVVVEPGTPAGYDRVLTARDALLAAGLRVVAPCPHQAPCPVAAGSSPDWCHFAVRVNRSALHRRAKGATLGYEDEKFAYVAAVAPALPARPTADRVLRHPVRRKGLVRLRLCTDTGAAVDETISRRQGARYSSARDAAWGDAWPPQDPAPRSGFRDNPES